MIDEELTEIFKGKGSFFCQSSAFCRSSVSFLQVFCKSSVCLLQVFCRSSFSLLLVFCWPSDGPLLDFCTNQQISTIFNFKNFKILKIDQFQINDYMNLTWVRPRDVITSKKKTTTDSKTVIGFPILHIKCVKTGVAE